MKYRDIAQGLLNAKSVISDLVAQYKEASIIKGIGGENVPTHIQLHALNNMHKAGNITPQMSESISQKLGLKR